MKARSETAASMPPNPGLARIHRVDVFRNDACGSRLIASEQMEWSHRLVVRTLPSQGGNTGSTPVGTTRYLSARMV